MLQINTVILGELTSPGVRHSRVQQNTSGLPARIMGGLIVYIVLTYMSFPGPKKSLTMSDEACTTPPLEACVQRTNTWSWQLELPRPPHLSHGRVWANTAGPSTSPGSCS